MYIFIITSIITTSITTTIIITILITVIIIVIIISLKEGTIPQFDGVPTYIYSCQFTWAMLKSQ